MINVLSQCHRSPLPSLNTKYIHVNLFLSMLCLKGISITIALMENQGKKEQNMKKRHPLILREDG